MSQESRENFGVKTLDQHWRVAGESGGGGGGGGGVGGGKREKERKDRKGMLRAR